MGARTCRTVTLRLEARYARSVSSPDPATPSVVDPAARVRTGPRGQDWAATRTVLAWGDRRWLLRWLAAVALSLSLSGALSLWIQARSSPQSVLWTAPPVLATTIRWLLVLLVALGGWALSPGFLTNRASEALLALARRRGYAEVDLSRAEQKARLFWLGRLGLGSTLLLVVPFFFALRGHDELMGWLIGSLAAMAVVTSAAVLSAGASVVVGRACEVRPRLAWLGLMALPELLRFLDPSLPTLWTLSGTLAEWVLCVAGS